MWKLSLFTAVQFTVLLQTSGVSEGYSWPWGEVNKDSQISALQLKPVKWLQVDIAPKTDLLVWGNALASDDKTELILTRNSQGFVAQVFIGKNHQMSPRFCSSFTPFFDNMYYCGYINDDNRIDFMLHFYCGGNGLNADFNEVTLLLSNEHGYEATSIQTYGGGPNCHYLSIKGKPHFIMKSFGYRDKSLDRKTHSFWTYNLFEIKENSLYLANQNHSNFPRTICFTEDPQKKEANLLSPEDKWILNRKSLEDVSLIGNKVTPCPSVQY
jgi:hypothetical protein